MTVPANTITRISLQYRVPNVDCITSFHIRNDTALTNDQWRQDVAGAGPIMMNELRRIQALAVTHTGATARVLEHPEVPSVSFTTGALGQTLGDPLPALAYAQIDLYSNFATAAGRRVRNAMRLSGIAAGFWEDNTLHDELEENWLNGLRGRAGTTWYSGNAAWLWVTAWHNTPVAPVSWATISAVNMRFSARVLSSRQR